MLYFANPSKAASDAMRDGLIGAIDTPLQGNRIDAKHWCADNGCFGKGYPGDEAYLEWLTSRRGRPGRCHFATAPDVVGDAAATLERSRPLLRRIRDLGVPVAFVGQNGAEDMTLPWDEFDVLFLGGDTAWKLGPHARDLTAQARERGKRVHMGRVNSLRRLKYADAIGCDSADGTFLVFGPDVNMQRLLAWLRAVNDQQPLWRAS